MRVSLQVADPTGRLKWAGSGILKSFALEFVSADVFTAGPLDTVCDAYLLLFAEESFDNIVMLEPGVPAFCSA